MKIKDIYSFLNERYPFSAACDFDNVGLLVGDENTTITKAVISLDCTKAALNFAINSGAELIITHHPVIFGGIKSVRCDTAVYTAVKNGISIISAHTNLDTADGGVNDTLCAALELENTEKIYCEDGFTFRKGDLRQEMTADELAQFAKVKLSSNARYVDGGKKIKTLAVCSGSGSDMLSLAMDSGADAYLSSEIKHNVFLTALENGFTCLDLGHYATERIIENTLKTVLMQRFTDTEFIIFNDNTIKYN